MQAKKAKLNWKNIYPLPANTVGEDAFDGGNKVFNLTGDKLIQWKDLPINRFIEKNGKRIRLKPDEVKPEREALIESDFPILTKPYDGKPLFEKI